MPDLQPPTPSASLPAGYEWVQPSLDDLDFALGCECADPALIEGWAQDARPDAS